MRLPNLRELAVYESPHSPDWITDVLCAFTMLHTLRLSVTAKSPLNRAGFEAALEAADCRVVIVDFGQLCQTQRLRWLTLTWDAASSKLTAQ